MTRVIRSVNVGCESAMPTLPRVTPVSVPVRSEITFVPGVGCQLNVSIEGCPQGSAGRRAEMDLQHTNLAAYPVRRAR
jgi:hypothetical protein